MEWMLEGAGWVSFASLALLEIVLGIDNIVFISILAARLPAEQQKKARLLGLGLALIGRVVLLFSLTWIMGLTAALFHLPFGGGDHAGGEDSQGFPISGRDLILLSGGLFLIYKATKEIHAKLEGEEHHGGAVKAVSFAAVITQILILDVVFSLDSVITAVGMANDISVMISAVVVAILVMMIAAKGISEFIERHPTIKMLALAFLLLIGTNLFAEGLHFHIPKGYTYFAMAFAIFVEVLNLRSRKGKPVQLRAATARPGAPEELTMGGGRSEL